MSVGGGGGELKAKSARGNILASVQRGVENYLQEAVKKAGHPESFELGLDAETTGNPEYQKIRAEKEAERKKESQPSRANTEPSVQYKKETRKAKDSDEVAADRYARLHSRSKK